MLMEAQEEFLWDETLESKLFFSPWTGRWVATAGKKWLSSADRVQRGGFFVLCPSLNCHVNRHWSKTLNFQTTVKNVINNLRWYYRKHYAFPRRYYSSKPLYIAFCPMCCIWVIWIILNKMSLLVYSSSGMSWTLAWTPLYPCSQQASHLLSWSSVLFWPMQREWHWTWRSHRCSVACSWRQGAVGWREERQQSHCHTWTEACSFLCPPDALQTCHPSSVNIHDLWVSYTIRMPCYFYLS